MENPPKGRPKKEDSEKKSMILQFRVTKREYEIMSESAEKLDKTISEWIREKVLGGDK